MELLAPGFSLIQPSCEGHFGNEPVVGYSLSLSLLPHFILCHSAFLMKYKFGSKHGNADNSKLMRSWFSFLH